MSYSVYITSNLLEMIFLELTHQLQQHFPECLQNAEVVHAAVAPLHVILPSEPLPPNTAGLGTEPHQLATSSVIT